jgi:hypothetical protein
VTPLMTAPYTDPTHAHTVVMTAGRANDSFTPDQRLGIVQQSATNPPLVPIALQRWESDGGAVQ